jgi:VCBS repeat-containing protein
MDFAFDPAGTLWAVAGNNLLFRVNPATGAGTFVANITGTNGEVMGLMIHPDTGTFYATTYTPTSALYTLNPTTGVATQVGGVLGTAFAHGGDFGTVDSQSVTVTPGGALSGINFGNRRDEETVRGVKFNDLDGDGVRDATEPGLAGWTVYADLNNNRRLDAGEPSAVTGADGSYALIVPSGTYTFREVPQAGWVQTAPASDRLFSARVPVAGGPQIITEYNSAGAAIGSFPGPVPISFQGPQGLAWSGDALFYIDGTQPTGSLGTHTLYELDPTTGAVIDSDVLPATTEINGLAYLGGLVYIEVHATNQILVFDPATDTVVRTLTVGADIFGGLTGAADQGLLFASTLPAQIVAIDPRTGAVVRTLSPNVGVLQGGLAYYHGELIASNGGTSTFRIDPRTGQVLGNVVLQGPGGSVFGLAGEGAVGGGRKIFIGHNQTVTLDFGNRRDEGTVSGVKFNDLDGDGTRDANEPALAGWTVYADLNDNRQLDAGEPSTTTAADGSYSLTVPSGLHTVREVAQSGWVQTGPLSYTLYATGLTGNQLVTVDPATGLATPVGGFGVPQTFSVAAAPDGTLWTVVNPFNASLARLARVNPANGLATPVGSPTWTGSPIIALEADAANNLYGASFNGGLYRLDATTGAATLIGPLGFFNAQDLAFDPAGRPWALDGGSNLFRVDPATGASAFVAHVTGLSGQAIGLMIHPGTGTLYVTTAGSILYTVDPATGQATPVGPFGRLPASPGGDFLVENGHTVFITPGVSLPGRDFANERDEGIVRGVKFDDQDGDGVRDASEPGLAGWTIYADLNDNGRPDADEPATTTGADGGYQLTLPSGDYTLREVLRAGWGQTSPTGDQLFALRATSPSALNIVQLDSLGFVTRTSPAPAPVATLGRQGLAVGPTSLFYVDGSSAAAPPRLYELDPFTGAVLDADFLTLPAPPPSGLAYLGGLVYILGSGTNQIQVFDPATDQVVRTLALTPASAPLYGGLTGAADLGLLFATDGGNTLFAIDPQTGAVVRTMSSPGAGFSGGLAYRAGELLGVPLSTSPAPIFRVDPVTGGVRGVLGTVGPNVTGLAGDGSLPGPYHLTVTPGAVLDDRDFGNRRLSLPVAADDDATVGEDDVLTVPAPGALGNDTGGLAPYTVTAVNGSAAAVGQTITLPSGSLLRVNGDGSYVYTPAAAFNALAAGATADDSFTYTLTDGTDATASATVRMTIIGANDAPAAGDDAGTTDEDTVLTVAAPGLLGNDTDPDDGTTLTVAAVNGGGAVGQPVTLASGAVVTVSADGSYTYDPRGAFDSLAAGQTATDSFTYTVSDGDGGTDTATVTLTIVGVNDAPVANPDAYATDEDTDLVVPAPGVLANDTDVDGGTLTAVVVSGPGNGTVTLNPDGSFTYHPAANFNGTDTFTYTVSDGQGGTATGTATVTVRPVNDAPTLAAATLSVRENSPAGTVVGTVAGADVDDTDLRYRITAGNTGGAFAIDQTTGRITVANAAVLDFEATPTFHLTVEVRDPAGLTATAPVTINLIDVIDPARIDIDPKSGANRFNSKSNGKLTVALLGSAEFDVRMVDVNSLRFGRTGQEDSVSLQPKQGPRYRLEDVNGDGRLDLVVEFEIEKTGFRPGDTRGILTGKFTNGYAFSAEDVVSVF